MVMRRENQGMEVGEVTQVEWRGVGEDEVTLHVSLIRTLVSTA